MNQDRRDAQVWAQEWAIRQRNKKIITVIIGILVAIAAVIGVGRLKIVLTRTTYGSEAEMRAALQGRFVYNNYEDIEILGDEVVLTYYELSHYDEDFAREYGYSQYEDSVYEDYVEKWDYRRGVIKLHWMSDITVDKSGRLVYYSESFRKTTAPRPEPFDPAILDDGSDSDIWTEEDEEDIAEDNEEFRNWLDSLDHTLDMADEADDAGKEVVDETENSKNREN